VKFGFDLHGVIDTRPEFFQEFMESLVTSRAEVHILSGPPAEACLMELSRHGFIRMVHFTHLFSIVDHLRTTGVKMWQDPKGHWWSEPYDWDRVKGEYCATHNIDLHFDDSDTYRYFFKTPFARFFSRDTERVNKTKVDYGTKQFES
jgi:hypothetical protein